MGAKTTETLKALGMVMLLKNANALQNELKSDYIITKELSAVAGGLALRCARLLAFANAALITTNHIDFSAAEQAHGNPQQLLNNWFTFASNSSLNWIFLFTKYTPQWQITTTCGSG